MDWTMVYLLGMWGVLVYASYKTGYHLGAAETYQKNGQDIQLFAQHVDQLSQENIALTKRVDELVRELNALKHGPHQL